MLNNPVLRRTSAVFVIMMMLVSCLPQALPVWAAEKKSTTTHYKFIIACVFIWGDESTGNWRPAAPGASFKKDTSTTLPSDAKNISIFQYDPNSSAFDLDRTPNVESWYDRRVYMEKYHPHAVRKLSASTNGRVSNGRLDYSWMATLTAQTKAIDVKEKLSEGKQQEIIDLMGGLTPDMKEFLDAKDRDFGSTIEGWLYFVPYVIQYDIEDDTPVKPPLSLDAELGLPSAAGLGESYKAEDDTVLPQGARFKSSTLEKNTGSGWQTVSKWKGTKLGESITETASQEGTIKYRLTVELQSGEKDTDEKTITVSQKIDIDAEAVLALPEWTYEGHPTLAEDRSLFTVNGERYSAKRAYEERLASSRMSIVESNAGSIRRLTNTESEVTFSRTGKYNVELRVSTSGGGGALYDTKPIEVLKTPAVEASLTGTQKENRKQIINIKVATHPSHPLQELWVKIENTSVSEDTAALYHNLGKKENALVNSETIKTRKIEVLPSDSLYTNCRLEFLTKNKGIEEYSFTVFAKDTRGNIDQKEVEFEVSPDLPPEADILVDDTHLRTPGTNTAVISLEDNTSTDGDQLERTWSADLGDGTFVPVPNISGYKDLSFGSGQVVEFDKDGVGNIKLRLHVRDVWVEETLEEYITEQDYLTDETEAETDVINVAPVVSIEPVKLEKAEVLILTGGEAETNSMNAAVGEIKMKLIEGGFDPDVKVQRMDVPRTSRTLLQTMTADLSFGYRGNWTFLESDNYAVDNQNAYIIEGTFADGMAHPDYPYVVRAYNAESGRQVWSYTITSKTMSIGAGDTKMVQDDAGRYLMIVSGGKTLLLDKKNGARLTTLSYAVNNCFSNERTIYDQQSDGIYAISMQDGKRTKVFGGNTDGGRRIHDKLHFLHWGGNKVYRAALDFKTGETKLYMLPGTGNDTPGAYQLAGIDSAGKMMISNAAGKGRIYSRDNQLLMEANGYTGKPMVPVYDEAGLCSYVCWAREGKASSSYYGDVQVSGIGGYHASQSVSSRNDYPTTDKIVFARSVNGSIEIVTGAEYANVLNVGYGAYPQRAVQFTFNPKTGVNKNAASTITQNRNKVEYGLQSEVYAAIRTGDNSQYSDGSRGNITEIVKWGQTMDEMTARYLNKYISTNSSLKAVVLYDTVNKEPTSKMTETLAVLNKFGSRVIHISGGQKNYTDVVADKMNAAVIGSDADIASGIAGCLTGEETLESVLHIKAGAKPGTLSKTFQLNPGKKYYYEYDIREIGAASADDKSSQVMDIGFSKTSILPETMLNSGGWKVTDAYFEDFNGTEFNPYFRLNPEKVDGGWYRGAQLEGKVKDNTYRTMGDTIYFTVPKGKKAILSFDYDLKMDGTQMWNANGFWIDDERWKLLMPKTMKGHYTHPDILEEGVHSLHMFAGEYSTYFSCYTVLDNLQVVFVEPGRVEDPSGMADDSSVSHGKDGWASVSGGIKVPGKSLGYREMRGDYYAGKLGEVRYTTADAKEKDRPYAAIDIPSGRTAVYAGVDTRLRSSDKVCSISWSSYSWRCRPANNRQENRNYLPSGEYRINMADVTGSQYISGNGNSYKGAYIYLDNVEMFLAQNSHVNELTQERRFFLSTADGKEGAAKKLYVANDVYNGDGTVTFHFDAGKEYQLRNFRIYTVENGKKSYLSESSITNSAELARWSRKDITAQIVQNVTEEEEQRSVVYKKGELVHYNIYYSDYEADPSKKQYWRYTHTPFNDGAHPDAAVILNADGKVTSSREKILDHYIDKFEIDGRYTVEHWQEDDTSRGNGGNPSYDKLSNVVSLTFYVEGSANAPWVESVKTVPAKVKEDSQYKIQIEVDDIEKDTLRLDTEVYYQGGLVYSHKKTNIKPDAATGRYAPIVTGNAPAAKVGNYEVVCTVRDQTGAGLGTYKFTVVSEGKITGEVSHTSQWDQNRKKYNMKRWKSECNYTVSFSTYKSEKAPRKRGTNVFWSGEQFELRSAVAGSPASVTAQIVGTSYSTSMKSTGSKNAQGETIYSASLWDKSMINKWGRKTPEQLTFRFTASYSGGITKTHDVTIIVDSADDYWQLHRLW